MRKTDDDTKRQLVLAHAIVFTVSICCLGGEIYLPPFFSNGPANQRRAGPSCDEPPTNLKVMVGVKKRKPRPERPGRGLWPDDGERAPPGGSAEARAATMVVRDDGKPCAMSREQVAKCRSEANRVTATVGTRVAS